MKKNNLIIGVIIALVIGGAIGFFGGIVYQKSQVKTFAAGGDQGFQRTFQGGQGQRRDGNVGFAGGARNGGAVRGEILSADDKSITVKLQDGSSKIILVTDKTSINKAAEANQSDLKTGETVAAFGTTNSDGSVTAVSIQLNPQLGGMQRPSQMPTPGK